MATIERRQLKRGTSFRVEWRHNGERHRLTFDTERDAEEWKHLIEAAGGNPRQADRALLAKSSSAPMLSEVAAEYIERLIDVSSFTVGSYKRHVRLHFPRLDMPIDQVIDDDVASWVAWMSKDAPNGKRTGYSPKTIENAHGFLYSVFAYAVKRRLRPDNPAADTRLPKKSVRDERDMFLTKEEFAVLLPHVPEQYKPHVVFLWGTGMRVSEMLALSPEDFTVDKGVAQVSISKALKMNESGAGATIGEPKTERSRRTIPVDGATMGYVWPLVRAAGHGEFVFPLTKPRTSSTFWKAAWKPTLDSATAKGFTKRPGVHSLRHSHASYLLSIGTAMQDVSDRLGHSSMATTDKVYRHRIAKDGAVIVALMDGAVPALPAPSTGDTPKALDPA